MDTRDTSGFVQSTFLEELERSGVQLSFAELVAARSPFNFARMQNTLDSRNRQRALRLRAGSLVEREMARREERRDQEVIESLTRTYAQIIIRESRRGHTINESIAERAKIVLKKTGKGCDIFPC